MKIWTRGSSPRSGSRNPRTRIKNVNGASRLSNFRNFFGAIQMISCQARLLTMDETWLYHCDPETKQQSIEWRHGGSPRPQKIRVQNSAGKVLASIFSGIKTASSTLSSKEPNYQRGALPISAGANEGHFEGKTPREGHQGCLVLARQCPVSPGTCNTEETGLPGLPMSWSPTLFSESDPVGLPPVSWTEKNNWKVAIFRPTRMSLLPRRPGWTDNLLNFFWVACKS